LASGEKLVLSKSKSTSSSVVGMYDCKSSGHIFLVGDARSLYAEKIGKMEVLLDSVKFVLKLFSFTKQ
jgi:hypothetical protein